MVVLSLLLGTLLSEDLTCIAAGLLIQRGELGAPAAVLACAAGIFAGDVGLWAIGRLGGHAALEWPWVARQLRSAHVDLLRDWLTTHAAGAIVGSRFLPGTRLPLYVIAGLARVPARVFAFWALIGTALWTPPLVLFSAGLWGRVQPTHAPGLWALGFGLWGLSRLTSRAGVALSATGSSIRAANVKAGALDKPRSPDPGLSRIPDRVHYSDTVQPFHRLPDPHRHPDPVPSQDRPVPRR